ncbi:MAG: hypothetical protein ACOYN5_03325 [Bacteroidales bacterium]
MIALYIFAGFFLLTFGWYSMSKVQNLILGSALVLYGFFRGYRMYNLRKVNIDQEDNDSE